MFIRFVVGADGDDHRDLTWLITEARLLRDGGGLNTHEISWLEETYAWFNANLPCPPFSSRHWPRAAASWFKEDAVEPIRRMWEIAHLLTEHGVPVRMLRSKSPGKVLYEDSYQVVVEEWKRL